MWRILGIGIGGFLGAICRYFLSGWIYRWWGEAFPYGTLVVNILGSFFLGLLMGVGESMVMNPTLRATLTIGLLGAFTTFSTFSYETVALVQFGDVLKAFVNVVVSVAFGLLAAWLGLWVGRWWVG